MRAPPTAADPAAVGRLGGHGQAEEGGALVDALEEAQDEPAQPRPGGEASAGQDELDGVLHAVVHRLHAGPEQVVPVGEVDVDGRAGDAGLAGDLVHGDVGGAALAEEPARRLDDLVAPEVADDLLQRVGRAPGHGCCVPLGRPAQAPTRADGREGHGEVLDAVDELGLQALHLAVLADVGHAVEQVLEHDPDLHAGQVGPEAEVGAAAAEGDVGVGVPGDVEGVGVGRRRPRPGWPRRGRRRPCRRRRSWCR